MSDVQREGSANVVTVAEPTNRIQQCGDRVKSRHVFLLLNAQLHKGGCQGYTKVRILKGVVRDYTKVERILKDLVRDYTMGFFDSFNQSFCNL